MAKALGRRMRVLRDGEQIAALRTKSFTVNREPVDVTGDDDDGWRHLLAEPGTRSVDISFAGVTEDDALIAAMLSGGTATFEDIVLQLATGAELHADFFFTGLNQTGEYNQALMFEGQMLSSGPVDLLLPLQVNGGNLLVNGQPLLVS